MAAGGSTCEAQATCHTVIDCHDLQEQAHKWINLLSTPECTAGNAAKLAPDHSAPVVAAAALLACHGLLVLVTPPDKPAHLRELVYGTTGTFCPLLARQFPSS